MRDSKVTRVLFVCLGNICRSPSAHGIFVELIERHGLYGFLEVDSCGTGDWHTGRKPDARAIAAAAQRGYDLTRQRARRVTIADFYQYDFILAMDKSNLEDLHELRPLDFRGYLGLFLDFVGETDLQEVPDPYYGGHEGFDGMFDLLEYACDALLVKLTRRGKTGRDSSYQ